MRRSRRPLRCTDRAPCRNRACHRCRGARWAECWGHCAEPQYAAPKRDIHADYAEEQELKKVLAMAEEGLNSRFSDMFKAFQYVDLDRSGRLSKEEISRALDMWNIPIDNAKLDELFRDCDADGNGKVSAQEYVDAVAKSEIIS